MMSQPSPAPFHVGMTPERVLAAAELLTSESHLLTWSLRDLATRLGVAPSVLYHHVGGKDVLCRGVVERVLGTIDLPDESLAWQDWFRELLDEIRRLVSPYPGVAKWLLMHGPTVPAVLPALEAGTAVLRSAGFGDGVPFAYALLVNTALLTITIGDDRLQHEGDGPRGHVAMMREFEEMPSASPDVRMLGRRFILPFASHGATADRMRADYFRLAVDTTIAGLATRLGSGPWPGPVAPNRAR